MFGNRRKKATAQATEMVRQPLAIFQTNHGTPRGFWNDPYVLGLIGTMLALLGQLASDNKLGQSDRAQLMIDGFSNLSNLNGAYLVETYVSLGRRSPQDPEFKAGGDDAQEIVEAFIRSQSIPKSFAAIMQVKFIDSLGARFSSE